MEAGIMGHVQRQIITTNNGDQIVIMFDGKRLLIVRFHEDFIVIPTDQAQVAGDRLDPDARPGADGNPF
jgi:hypothetical protein